MIRKTYLLFSVFALAIVLGFTSQASADPIVLGFSARAAAVDPIILDGVSGSSVSYITAFENPLSQTLFLNGSDVDLPAALLPNFNDLLFANFPPSVDPGDTTPFAALFTINLPLSLAPGTYDFSYTLLGGFTPDELDPIADPIAFQLNVQSAETPVPEPGTWLLLTTGVGALGTVLSRRRQLGLGRAV